MTKKDNRGLKKSIALKAAFLVYLHPPFDLEVKTCNSSNKAVHILVVAYIRRKYTPESPRKAMMSMRTCISILTQVT